MSDLTRNLSVQIFIFKKIENSQAKHFRLKCIDFIFFIYQKGEVRGKNAHV